MPGAAFAREERANCALSPLHILAASALLRIAPTSQLRIVIDLVEVYAPPTRPSSKVDSDVSVCDKSRSVVSIWQDVIDAARERGPSGS